jgi:hypothetical protein
MAVGAALRGSCLHAALRSRHPRVAWRLSLPGVAWRSVRRRVAFIFASPRGLLLRHRSLHALLRRHRLRVLVGWRHGNCEQAREGTVSLDQFRVR